MVRGLTLKQGHNDKIFYNKKFDTNFFRKKTVRCYTCQQFGHVSRNCPGTNDSRTDVFQKPYVKDENYTYDTRPKQNQQGAPYQQLPPYQQQQFYRPTNGNSGQRPYDQPIQGSVNPIINGDVLHHGYTPQMHSYDRPPTPFRQPPQSSLNSILSDAPFNKGKVNGIVPNNNQKIEQNKINQRLADLERRVTGIHNLLEKIDTKLASNTSQTKNFLHKPSTCDQSPHIPSLGIRTGPPVTQNDLHNDQSYNVPSGHLLTMMKSPAPIKPSCHSSKYANFSSADYHKKCAVSTTTDRKCAFGTKGSDKAACGDSNDNLTPILDNSKSPRSPSSILVSKANQPYSTGHSIGSLTKLFVFIFLGYLVSPATLSDEPVQSKYNGTYHLYGTMVLGLRAIRMGLPFVSFFIGIWSIFYHKLSRITFFSNYMWYHVNILRKIVLY